VGSGVFKSEDPPQTAKAIVQAVKHWRDAEKLARIAADFSGPMRGLRIDAIPEHELLQKRGW
jgi:pyridoxal 5'-phosphate synthase pdxS subunit